MALKVLLADDEIRALRHLMAAVPWGQLGLEVCGMASNGKEALDFIERNPVDILITDIRMKWMGLSCASACGKSTASWPSSC